MRSVSHSFGRSGLLKILLIVSCMTFILIFKSQDQLTFPY